MARVLREGDSPFRTANVRMFVSRAELSSKEIRFFATKDALEMTVLHSDKSAVGAVLICHR